MADQILYGVAHTFSVVLPKLDDTDFARSADYTYASGDFKISKDFGTAANLTTAPTAVAMGANTALWKVTLTATETQAGDISVIVDDAALEHNHWAFTTYGHPSSKHPYIGIPIVSGTLSGTHTTTSADLGANAPGEIEPNSLLVNVTTGEARFVSGYTSGTGVVSWADALGSAWTNGDHWYIVPGATSGLETKIDVIDTVVDAIKVVTDALPNNGALSDLVSDVSAVLTDTGTTLPATLSTVEGKIDTVDSVADAIKLKTDNLTFTSGAVQVDLQKINTVDVVGDGTAPKFTV